MTNEDDISQIKDQLRKLEIKVDVLREFTIDEIAKTRAGLLKENKEADSNSDKSLIYQ